MLQFQVDSKGPQPYLYMYPFSPTLPSHPDCEQSSLGYAVGPANIPFWNSNILFLNLDSFGLLILFPSLIPIYFGLKISPQLSLIKCPASYFAMSLSFGRAFTWWLFSLITEFHWQGFSSLLLVLRWMWTKQLEAVNEARGKEHWIWSQKVWTQIWTQLCSHQSLICNIEIMILLPTPPTPWGIK